MLCCVFFIKNLFFSSRSFLHFVQNLILFCEFSCRRHRCKSLDGICVDEMHFPHDINFTFSPHIYSVASAFSTANGSATGKDPELAITTSWAGLSRPSVLVLSILRTTSIPLIIFPNTTWRPSSHVVCFVVMKNCDPLVSFPDDEKKENEERLRERKGKKIYLRWPSTTIRSHNASAWSSRLRNVRRRLIGRQFHLHGWSHRLKYKFVVQLTSST